MGLVIKMHDPSVLPTYEQASKLLDYRPNTGLFYWRIPIYANGGVRIKEGTVAGSLRPNGYMQIVINGKSFLAHRLAWLLMTGKWPGIGLLVDHINNNSKDNRWCNLRLATPAQSIANRRPRPTNSGFPGVYRHKNGTFRAAITLGTFSTAEDAHTAYVSAKKKLHGEFFPACAEIKRAA